MPPVTSNALSYRDPHLAVGDDGTVYAGLSMQTGKPIYVAAAGRKNKDGTVYAGVSPDTGKELSLTPADAPGAYTWDSAMAYCKALAADGHHDWRLPTLGELAVQFINRADIAFAMAGAGLGTLRPA